MKGNILELLNARVKYWGQTYVESDAKRRRLRPEFGAEGSREYDLAVRELDLTGMTLDDFQNLAASAFAATQAGEDAAREVHAAWRDGMLHQNREVAPARMDWDTLSSEDRELDAYIAQRVNAVAQAEIDRLRKGVEAVRDEFADHWSKLSKGEREGSWGMGSCVNSAAAQLDRLLRNES